MKKNIFLVPYGSKILNTFLDCNTALPLAFLPDKVMSCLRKNSPYSMFIFQERSRYDYDGIIKRDIAGDLKKYDSIVIVVAEKHKDELERQLREYYQGEDVKIDVVNEGIRQEEIKLGQLYVVAGGKYKYFNHGCSYTQEERAKVLLLYYSEMVKKLFLLPKCDYLDAGFNPKHFKILRIAKRFKKNPDLFVGKHALN